MADAERRHALLKQGLETMVLDEARRQCWPLTPDEALELFAAQVLGEFKEREAERERRKAEELAPFIEAALARKQRMPEPADADIPTFPALGRRITEEDSAGQSIYEKPDSSAG